MLWRTRQSVNLVRSRQTVWSCQPPVATGSAQDKSWLGAGWILLNVGYGKQQIYIYIYIYHSRETISNRSRVSQLLRQTSGRNMNKTRLARYKFQRFLRPLIWITIQRKCGHRFSLFLRLLCCLFFPSFETNSSI